MKSEIAIWLLVLSAQGRGKIHEGFWEETALDVGCEVRQKQHEDLFLALKLAPLQKPKPHPTISSFFSPHFPHIPQERAELSRQM